MSALKSSSKKLLNFFIYIFGLFGNTLIQSNLFLGTYFLIYYNYRGLNKKFIQKYFSVKQITTTDGQIMFFVKFGFYFALFMIATKLIETLFSLFVKLQSYKKAVESSLKDSLEYFVIVVLLMVFLVSNKKDWNVKKNAPLFVFWFLLARIVEIFGNLINKLTGLNVKFIGIVITYAIVALLVSDVLGFDKSWLFNIKKLNSIKF